MLEEHWRMPVTEFAEIRTSALLLTICAFPLMMLPPRQGGLSPIDTAVALLPTWGFPPIELRQIELAVIAGGRPVTPTNCTLPPIVVWSKKNHAGLLPVTLPLIVLFVKLQPAPVGMVTLPVTVTPV